MGDRQHFSILEIYEFIKTRDNSRLEFVTSKSTPVSFEGTQTLNFLKCSYMYDPTIDYNSNYNDPKHWKLRSKNSNAKRASSERSGPGFTFMSLNHLALLSRKYQHPHTLHSLNNSSTFTKPGTSQ